MARWDTKDVATWVTKCLKLPHGPTFEAAGVDGQALVHLTEEDLKELGVDEPKHVQQLMTYIGIFRSLLGKESADGTKATSVGAICRTPPKSASASKDRTPPTRSPTAVAENSRTGSPSEARVDSQIVSMGECSRGTKLSPSSSLAVIPAGLWTGFKDECKPARNSSPIKPQASKQSQTLPAPREKSPSRSSVASIAPESRLVIRRMSPPRRRSLTGSGARPPAAATAPSLAEMARRSAPSGSQLQMATPPAAAQHSSLVVLVSPTPSAQMSSNDFSFATKDPVHSLASCESLSTCVATQNTQGLSRSPSQRSYRLKQPPEVSDSTLGFNKLHSFSRSPTGRTYMRETSPGHYSGQRSSLSHSSATFGTATRRIGERNQLLGLHSPGVGKYNPPSRKTIPGGSFERGDRWRSTAEVAPGPFAYRPMYHTLSTLK